MRLIALLLLLPLVAIAQPAPRNVLLWDDASTNEANFHIERKQDACGTSATFAEIATVGANIATFTDNQVQEGLTYCYRVRASNPGGFSAYSNEAGRTVPFVIPGTPTNLRIQ